MIKNDFNWKVAGFAGQGIKATGELFSRVCVRQGLFTFDYTEYPSLIKGGHNTYQVHASTEPVSCQAKKLDFLLALNKNALIFHKEELGEDSVVIYDGQSEKIDLTSLDLPCKGISIPFLALARQAGGDTLHVNNVALGAVIYLVGIDLKILLEMIAQVFAKKKAEVIKLNQAAATAGYDFAKTHSQPVFELASQPTHDQYLLTGNEAIALGALAGGLQFYAAYPMSPSTSILEYLAETALQTQIVVKHAEDEISVINMAIGASYAGARSMVATSGGGFDYMVEAVGLAGMAELPLVIVECQRPGPALGMPTWTAQGDLRFIIHASQDEFPRIVLTPGDAAEAFECTRQAQILAEKYQIPVFVLSDKFLSESRFSCSNLPLVFDNPRYGFLSNPSSDETGFFPRYYPTPSGVSFRTKPGENSSVYLCNSYEHDRYGLATEESEVRVEQMEKRMRKLSSIQKEIPLQKTQTHPQAKLGVISFGSTKGVIDAAREILEKRNFYLNTLHLDWVWPFPTEQIKQFIAQNPQIVVVENNFQKQLAGLITQETGQKINHFINQYDGRPFYPEDLAEKIRALP